MMVAPDVATGERKDVIELAKSEIKQDQYVKARDRLEIVVEKAASASSPSTDGGNNGDKWIATVEQALALLARCYRELGQGQALARLVKTAREILVKYNVSKAKTAKLTRGLIDNFTDLKGGESEALQIQVTEESIEWARKERRVFLRQSLETRLVALYLDQKAYTEALKLIQSLLVELKKLDDKLVLVEVQLLESRAYHSIRNLPRARAALTSARTSANAVYCPPPLQAQLDMQSGILLAEDKDYRTAFTYFMETFESFSSQDDRKATLSLKYMLLCKIMQGSPDDVTGLLNSKLALKYIGSGESTATVNGSTQGGPADLEAMKAVTKAVKAKSLNEFEKVLKLHRRNLHDDPIVRAHLSALYNQLMESNIQRVVQPYSRVEITKVADLVGLDQGHVESKLSQMILDKKINGVLDQGAGSLVLFEDSVDDKTYEAALETIKSLDSVVTSLFTKAAALS